MAHGRCTRALHATAMDPHRNSPAVADVAVTVSAASHVAAAVHAVSSVPKVPRRVVATLAMAAGRAALAPYAFTVRLARVAVAVARARLASDHRDAALDAHSGEVARHASLACAAGPAGVACTSAIRVVVRGRGPSSGGAVGEGTADEDAWSPRRATPSGCGRWPGARKPAQARTGGEGGARQPAGQSALRQAPCPLHDAASAHAVQLLP